MALAAREDEAMRHLAHARALVALGRLQSAADAVERGLSAAAGTDTPVEARLAVERARIVTHATFGEGSAAIDAARTAVEVAGRAGACGDLALLELARALYAGADPACLGSAEEARRALARNGDVEGLLDASTWLSQMHEAWRDAARAARLAQSAIELADRHRKKGQAAVARWQAARLRWLGGDLSDDALEQFDAAVSGAPLGAYTAQGKGELALALADAGRHEAAAAVLDRPDDELSSHDLLSRAFYRAELALLAGDDARVVAEATSLGAGNPFVALARDWALVAAGVVPIGTHLGGSRPVVAGFSLEAAAFRSLRDGRVADAITAFDEAAALHDGHFTRHGLRCAWGAGLLLVRHGHRRDGRRVLLDLEGRAHELRSESILRRARAALRPFEREQREWPTALSERQREVLELVGEGRTTAEVADALGIGAATVETHIASARTKLGVATRVAAAAAIAEPRPRPPLRPDLLRVARLLSRGSTVGEVAHELGLSARTVSRRVAELRTTLDTHSTAAAVAAATADVR